MSGRVIAVLAAIVITASAFAESFVIYPFSSRDSYLGPIVAERVATALRSAGYAEVYGPAVAPSLVPPMPIGGGFLNPTVYLRDGGVDNRFGTALLRDSLGADAVVTGAIAYEGDQLVARLLLGTRSGIETYVVRAADTDPGGLSARIVAATARRLGLQVAPQDRELDLSGPDGDLAQALTLIAAGLIEDARRLLASVEEPDARVLELLAAMQEFERGGFGADPALLATLAINRQPLDEAMALEYFDNLARQAELPAASLWAANLALSLNDVESAESRFEDLPGDFTYGRMALASFLHSVREEGVDELLGEALESEDAAALAAVLVLAGEIGDTELEKAGLERLSKVSPHFVYPFERLSFIAFDENDPLAAARALAVAVELAPDSDLYWTNLGWAYYLLGMLDKSEQASVQALMLAPRQYIAQYNLGLVQAVTGRLDEAIETYRLALRVDPEVDDAAIDDLEQALVLYPREPAIHYVLGMLLESEGRREDAAEQFSQYTARSNAEPFRAEALRRVEVLTAPLPPIELTDGLVTVRLGMGGIAAAPYHPGDPLYPSFEVYTPGEELPQRLQVDLTLVAPDGSELHRAERSIEVPDAAIGFVVDDIELELPTDLTEGTYRVDVSVTASEGRSAEGSVHFEVSGEPQLIRRLLGRDLLMQALDTGIRLYGAGDLGRPEILPEVLLRELQSGADVAEQALPDVESGRFEGMSGGELFRASTEADVIAFLDYLLSSGARSTSFVFVEAFAQWALDGAPTTSPEQ